MSFEDPAMPSSYPDRLAFPINYVMGAIYIGLYLIGVPLFVYFRHHEPIKSRGWIIPVFQMTVVLVELVVRMLGFFRVTCVVDVLRFLLLIPLWIYPYFLRVLVLWYNFNFQNVLLMSNVEKITRKIRIIFWVQAHPRMTYVSTQLLIIAILGVFTASLALGLYYTHLELVEEFCSFFPAFVVAILQGVAALIFLAGSVVLLWGVNDAYLLKLEFITLFSLGLPLFVLWAISSTSKWMGFANPGFWVNLVQISFICATIYLPLIGTRFFVQLIKRQMSGSIRAGDHSSMNSGHAHEEDLKVALENEVLRKYLEQYMVQSWTVENLIFLKKLAEFYEAPVALKGALAVVIQRDFIQAGGLCELNLEMKEREEVNERIMSNDFADDLFLRAEKHVKSLLRYSILPQWRNSSSFREALKVLKVSSLEELKREHAFTPSKKLELSIDIQLETV